MRIANYPPNFQPAATSQKARSESASFGSQLDLAAIRSKDRYELSAPVMSGPKADSWEYSAYMNLMSSYEEWKAKQPPQDLPVSQGPTAENIAWLKDRYTGDLSWEERVDVLETMTQMGVISREQRNDAMGGGLVWYDPKTENLDDVLRAHRRSDSQDWNIFFREDPVSGFKTADDVFAWLDEVLTGEN